MHIPRVSIEVKLLSSYPSSSGETYREDPAYADEEVIQAKATSLLVGPKVEATEEQNR